MTDETSPAPIRCVTCGSLVSPRHLIGNALANGAAPAMFQAAMRATRLYTDEFDALRKRVAELEEIGEQARQRIAELESGLPVLERRVNVGDPL